MKTMKKFLKDHVIFAAIMTIITYLVIQSMLQRFLPNEKALEMYLKGDPSLDMLLGDVGRIVAILFFTLPIMKLLGTFKKSGLQITKGIGKGLLLGSGIILFCWIAVGYSMIDSIKVGMQGGIFSLNDFKFAGLELVGLVIVTCLLVGIMEETLCRGIMFLNMLDKWGNSRKGLLKAIIVSALPFGLLHLLNLTETTITVSGSWIVIFQVIYATTFGIFIAVLYLRCKNIWALILVHGCIDLAQFSLYIFIPSNKMYELDKFNAITPDNFIPQCIFYGIFALSFLIAAFILFRKVKIEEKEISKEVNRGIFTTMKV